MPVDATLPDVAVVGLGPAGRALAHRCRARGLSVVAVDLSPDGPWHATYGAWSDELPDWLPANVIAGRSTTPAVRACSTRTVHRTYCVFDTGRLQSLLSLRGADIIAGKAAEVSDGAVTMSDGSTVRARHIIDARGVGNDRKLAKQTAYGVVLDSSTAAPAMEGHSAWFMDWKRDNGTAEDDVPSFLYAVPVGHDRVLLEETCLVGRPPLPIAELRTRLETRLTRRNVVLPDEPVVERVAFVVEPPATETMRHGPLRFGSRGGFIHPGTGYSVASALVHADRLAEALAADTAPHAVLWPYRAQMVARLRRTGLRVLLDLDARHVDHFFEAFFSMPVECQRAYLSSRTDLIRTLAAMWHVFRSTPNGVRCTILRGVFSRYRR